MDRELQRELILRARERDAEAFAQLYTDCYRSLYKTAYYLIGNAQEAEDVVMDAVADAWSSIDKLRDAEAFPAWIYRILTNKARRLRGAIAYRATDELTDNIEGSGITAERMGENADLLHALDTLSQQDRSIVVLAICEGYTSQEIGRILSVNANTVRSRQLRALARLRAVMEPDGKEGRA